MKSINPAHTPEARAKAGATNRLRSALKKANGSTSTIDVSSLPQKPAKRRRRHHFAPQERAQIMQRIRDAVAGGMMIKDACKKEDIGTSVYTRWNKHPRLAKLDTPKKANGSAVQLTVQIAGNPVSISLEDARSIRAGLNALLG